MPNNTTTTPPVRTAMIGCGRMALGHIRTLLSQQTTTQLSVLCEPSPAAYARVCELFTGQGLAPPPNEPDLNRLLDRYGAELDAAFIITPHAYHYTQTKACMEAGLDVLLEKPMVVSAAEAEGLMATRDQTGRLLVVAFPGSLSPQIRTAVQMLRGGELGTILTISGLSWENWRTPNIGTWRQQPELSGGGFFFDTGAHMLNTITDLAGEDFAEVAAWFDPRDTPVEVLGVVMARLRSGALVTMHACGDTCTRSTSDVRVFCTQGILFTNIWGHFLTVQRPGQSQPEPVEAPKSLGVWQQFLAVRNGEIANPCPPEVGLRMARLWDAIRASAAQGGKIVSVNL
ncbi:MAG: gfo/Idh/MocA family oxidoreductase [Chloroflexi bacterium]|nr:MAG: gfo/Idh/MocA family oxidoreductase [Chloroflexota bacterium]